MAEAIVGPRSSRFFCHKCSTEISPELPDFTCPVCHGGFIEEVGVNNESESRTSESADSESDVDHTFDSGRFLSMFLSGLGETPNRPRNNSRTSLDPGPSTSNNSRSNADSSSNINSANTARSSSTRLQSFPPRGQSRITLQRVGPRDQRGDPAQDMIMILQQLLGMNNPMHQGPSGFIFPVQMLNLHGNPRDYVWGEGGLDAIITQLLNNVEGQGPSPAAPDDISKLQMVTINNEHTENSLECPVCKDEFNSGDEAKQMPCKHLFHPNCIVPWLELHNSCPVCRKSLDGISTEKDIDTDGNGSSDTVPPNLF